MKWIHFVAAGALCLLPLRATAIPNDADFSVSETFPATAAFGWAGAALPDGRYVIWNGDTVYVQRVLGEGMLDAVASGYAGDPGFVLVKPSGTELLLGSGFSGNLYSLDLNAPVNYTSGMETAIGSHYSGVYISPTLLAVDRGDFGSPAEIVVLDVSGARNGLPSLVLQLPPPPPEERGQVVEKPLGSFSASLGLDTVNGLLYVTDSGNGQIKSFLLADIINAYNTATPLDWSLDGTNFGTPFQFPMGGVKGFTASGNAVIPGFGSIVEVDPIGPTVVKTLDPAGTSPFYTIIYNSVTEDLIVFQDNYPNPSIVHTTAALPPLPLSTLLTWACGLMLTAFGARRILAQARK